MITPEFVEALRSAALTFQVSQPIRHFDVSRVQFGALMIVAYEGRAYGIEDARTGRRIMEVQSGLPLCVIAAVMEFYRFDRVEDAIIHPDPRQSTFDF